MVRLTAAATLLLVSAPMALTFAPGTMLGLRPAVKECSAGATLAFGHCMSAQSGGARLGSAAGFQAWAVEGSGYKGAPGSRALQRRERARLVSPSMASAKGAADAGGPKGSLVGTHGPLQEFLSGTSLWICFGVASLVAYEQLVLKVATDLKSIALTFCHVLVIHKLDRLRDKPTLKSSVARAFYVGRFNKRTAEKCILGFAAAFGSYLWFQSDLLVQVIYAFHFLLGITFVSPILPLWLNQSRAGVKPGKTIKTKVALRQTFVMVWKAFIIVMAALFASRADAAALASDAMRVELDSIALFAAAASFSAHNMQDIRDLDDDRITGRQTIPAVSGIKDSRNIVTFINVAAIFGQIAMSVLIGSSMGGLIRLERLFVHLVALGSVWFLPRTTLLFSFIAEALCGMPFVIIFGLRLLGGTY